PAVSIASNNIYCINGPLSFRPAAFFDEGHGSCRIAFLEAADDVQENVARRGFLVLPHAGLEVIRLAAFGIGPGSLHAGIERPAGIAEFFLFFCSHDAEIDEGRGDSGDLRIVGIRGGDDGNFMFAGKGDKVRRFETVMPYLDRMAELIAVETLRQQLEE